MVEFRVRFRKGGLELYQTVVISLEGIDNSKEALRKLRADPQMYRELNYTGVEIIEVENLVDATDL